MIKLARIGYKALPGELVVDITVRNNPNHVLSPTWDMVMQFNRGAITWDTYVTQYMNLLRERWTQGRKQEFIAEANLSKEKTLVLVCFCTNELRCHRTLAKAALEAILAKS